MSSVSTSCTSISGAADRQERLAGEDEFALGHRPDVAGEAQVGQPFEEDSANSPSVRR